MWRLPEKTDWMREQNLHEPTRSYAQEIFEVVRERPHSQALEIGSAWGVSALAILMGTEAHLTAVDPDSTNHATSEVVANGYEDRFSFNLMRSDEFWPKNKQVFDLIYIDGSHLYEWWDLPKEPRALVQLSPAGLDKYYNRQLLTAIKQYMHEKVGMMPIHIPVDYTPIDWDDQREIMGRSLLYISQQFDSPMSRGRTEAMLSGCCILSSRHDDVEMFIENGVNGFLLPDNPLSYAEVAYQLVNHSYRDAVEIGQRGKATAQKYFNTPRYLADLYKVVKGVAEGNPPVWDGSTIYDKVAV